jgi:hypothetical protein
LSNHSQKGFVPCGKVTCIDSEIKFGIAENRHGYYIAEFYDVHTTERTRMQQNPKINWNERFDGIVDNLLSRGSQNSNGKYTPTKLKAIIKNDVYPYFSTMFTQLQSKKNCEICNCDKKNLTEIYFQHENNRLIIFVGAVCLQYIKLAHRMLHYVELKIDPQQLQDEYSYMPNIVEDV